MDAIYTSQRVVAIRGNAVLLSDELEDWHLGVRVKAKPGNAGVVYIGNAGKTLASTGYALSPGDEYSFLERAYVDLNKISIDAEVNGDGVCIVARL